MLSKVIRFGLAAGYIGIGIACAAAGILIGVGGEKSGAATTVETEQKAA